MKNCANCRFSIHHNIFCWECKLGAGLIRHPRLMGGPRKCKCYRESKAHKTMVFKYPNIEDWHVSIELMEASDKKTKVKKDSTKEELK